jgi:hypothetical protein
MTLGSFFFAFGGGGAPDRSALRPRQPEVPSGSEPHVEQGRPRADRAGDEPAHARRVLGAPPRRPLAACSAFIGSARALCNRPRSRFPAEREIGVVPAAARSLQRGREADSA